MEQLVKVIVEEQDKVKNLRWETKKGKDSSLTSSTSKDSWKWNTDIDNSTQTPLPTFVGNLPGPKGEAIGVRNQLKDFQLFLSS